ncbi:MAG: 2-oxoacid:acceptor oxidoreductase family protein [Deferribacterales bacterium]
MIKGVICGKGGQGVITLNAMIGTLASGLGLSAISAETHGMAMRGGSVATYIKIGEGQSASVALGDGDFIISLTRDEALRNLPYLRRGGVLILDTEDKTPIDGDFRIISLDATGTAHEKFGNKILAGQILLGAFLGCFRGLDVDKALEILKNAPKINIDAVKYGVENAQTV